MRRVKREGMKARQRGGDLEITRDEIKRMTEGINKYCKEHGIVQYRWNRGNK